MAWLNLGTKTSADANASADVNALMENIRVLGGNGTSVPSTDIESLNSAIAPIGMGGRWPVAGSIPTGWLAQDGTALSRTTYATLFALIGTTYGVGDGSTTFNIPDTETEGDFIRHFKSGVSAAIGTHQADQFQGFQVGASADNTGARDYWGKSGTRDMAPSAAGSANDSIIYNQTTAQGLANMLKAMNDGTNGDPRTGTTTYPVNMAMIYIIKVS